MPTFGSIGILPRNGIAASSAIFFPPPERKISVFHPQCGQMNPLMFSTTPIMGIFNLRAKVIAFLTTALDSAVGMVTITTPSISGRSCAILRGSSPVPGGRSMKRKSSSPRRCLTGVGGSLIFSGPRQIVGVFSGKKKSIDITFMSNGACYWKSALLESCYLFSF